MNPIANMSHVLRKYKGRPIPLDHEFGEAPMYCGWGNRRLGLSSSPLANPYTEKSNARKGRIRVASRDEAIEMYRRWLWKQICADNQQVLEELHQVTPTTTLICWCAPKRCHCEVISRAADWLRQQTSPSTVPFTYEFIEYGLVRWQAGRVSGICNFTTIEDLREEVSYCVSNS